MKKPKLNITFHSPNTVEETTAVLIQIAAETAKLKIINMIHNEKSEDETEKLSI